MSSSASSPQVLRMQQLSQKLRSTEQALHAKKLAAISSTERRVDALNAQLHGQGPEHSDPAKDMVFAVLRENIQQLYEHISAQRLALELVEERKSKELQVVENALALDVVLERHRALEQANGFAVSLAQAARDMREQAAQVRDTVAETEHALSRQTRDEIDRLAKALDEERRAREAAEQRAQHGVASEIADLRMLLAQEQREQQQSEQNMMRALDDLVARCHAQLEAERRERESMQEALLSTLEAAFATLRHPA